MILEHKLEYTTDENNILTSYFIRGHVEKEKFLDVIEAQGEVPVNPNWIKNCYAQSIRTMSGDNLLILYEKHRRGRFPITYVDVDFNWERALYG